VERKVHESKPAAKVVAEADTIVKDDAKGVFDVVEQMPQFPGGAPELMRYLSMNIKYPEEAHQAGVMGRVIVTFVVEKDGSISEPTVIRPIHSSLDAEALRVVSAMPKWEPGMQNGEPVRVKYTVPITFSLKGSDNSAEDYKNAYDVVKNTAPDFSMQNVKILVDGKPVKNLTIVSTDNVTGIQILKDAESLAKYDAKDKYAVVLVTSKHVDTQQE
jgi:TonB family protein